MFHHADHMAQKISPWFWQNVILYTLDSLLDCEAPDSSEIDHLIQRLHESGASYPVPLTARLLLRDNHPDEAVLVLDHTLADLKGQPPYATVRIHALRALAYQAKGNEKQALDALRQALELGELENRVASFVREGAAMEKLLRLAQAKAITPGFVERLLAAFEARRKVKPQSYIDSVVLVEPLSEREMDILKLLARGCSDKVIAKILLIAPDTVHKHLGNIYSKLGVHTRMEAILRAREIGLL
jgi:ATP/maltotriose-dependent transcriptional regulator MalT